MMENPGDYFSPEDEEQLIEFVRGYPQVYDTHHPGYKGVETKANIWREIADYMNKNDEACKVKWKYIRDWYQRKKKEGKLPTGSGALAAKMRKRYEYLTFLDSPSPPPTLESSTTTKHQTTVGNIIVTVKEEKDAEYDGIRPNWTEDDIGEPPNRTPKRGIETAVPEDIISHRHHQRTSHE